MGVESGWELDFSALHTFRSQTQHTQSDISLAGRIPSCSLPTTDESAISIITCPQVLCEYSCWNNKLKICSKKIILRVEQIMQGSSSDIIFKKFISN